MKLQVAMDVWTYKEARRVGKLVAPYIDIFEVGTPLLLAEGMKTIKKAKDDFGLPVFADTKSCDAGRTIAERAADYGAGYITVISNSYDKNISETVKACWERGVESVADTIGASMTRVLEVEKLGVDIVELHTGYQNEVGGRRWDDLIAYSRRGTKPISIAGGLWLRDMERLKRYKRVETIVIGRAIVRALDPAKEAKAIRDAISTF